MQRVLARWSLRVALSIGGVLAAAGLLEAALRVGAWVFSSRAERAGPQRPPGPGGITVLCAGDSSVYGLYLEPPDTFPSRLERLLNEGDPAAPHRVVNRGIPGSNSQQAVERLALEVPRYLPRAIVWHCGVNDLWALPDARGFAPGWGSELRVVRLARLLAARFGPERRRARALGAEGSPVWKTREGDSVPLDLQLREEWLEGARAAAVARESLGRLRRLCDVAGAVPFVLLYPKRTGPWGTSNAAMEVAAKEEGIALVDPSPAFASVVSRCGEERIYYPDYHPQALGYEVFARLLHDVIVERGLVAGGLLGDPLEGLDLPPPLEHPDVSGDRSQPDIRLTGTLDDAEGPVLEIRDRPGLHLRLLLSLANSPPTTFGGFSVPLAADPLWVITQGQHSLVARVGEDGVGRFPLRQLLRDPKPEPGLRFFAAYGIVLEPDNPWVLGVSGSRELVLR